MSRKIAVRNLGLFYHLGLADWYAKQWELQKSAESRREEAFNLRNAGRTIRSETQIKTEWDTRLNTVRLSDRLIFILKLKFSVFFVLIHNN